MGLSPDMIFQADTMQYTQNESLGNSCWYNPKLVLLYDGMPIRTILIDRIEDGDGSDDYLDVAPALQLPFPKTHLIYYNHSFLTLQ
jgi:hypothetical protein